MCMETETQPRGPSRDRPDTISKPSNAEDASHHDKRDEAREICLPEATGRSVDR